MRIQHNIMAMNAYRNYTNNVSAMKSNLEKLSSGYKINRAGDDAAGLAISEKMRAQITGLETAQKNAKDGISLVQTAEGALTEVHDMLNRMVELATQSSNGTYDNTTDRAQLQKELDQLRTEIDRIADSSNFNGINLLDGSMAVKAAVEASTSTSTESVTGMDRIITSVIGKGEKAYEVAGEKTILDGNGAQATRAQFQIDLNTLDLKPKSVTYADTWAVTAATATGSSNLKFSIQSGTLYGANGNIKVKIATATGTVKASNVDATYVANGTSVTVTYKLANGNSMSATFNGLTYASNVTVSSGTAANNFAIEIGDGKIEANGIQVTASMTSATLAKAIASAMAAGNSSVKINGVMWDVSASNGKLTFVQQELPETADEARANFDVRISTSTGSGPSVDLLKITLAQGSVEDESGITIDMAASIKAGTYVAIAGVAQEDANKANTIFNITEDDLTDGTQIAIGTKTVVLAVGPNSKVDAAKYQLAGATVVSLNADDSLNTALSKISNALGSVVNFKILDKDGNEQLVEFQIGVSDNALGFPSGLAVQRVRTVASDGTANPALEGLAFDSLEKLAQNFAMNVNKTTTTEAQEATAGLKLQIGDTADPYNQLVVSINDCHAEAIGIGDIDISTQEGAEAAVKKIKDAINYVSDVRGTLGATQNRLDHTINNLSVMTENIQDAESTIRDVDVAEEMMAYTKNNILIQSAQAMLAQANQVPQGVLQLLQ